MKKVLFTLILALVANSIIAQDYKFGKVSKEELEEQYYPQDSSANAVILYKNRNTHFEYVQGDGFQVVTEIQERIKIYNSEGFDWATKNIDLYQPPSGGEEKVSSLKAVTYSIEKGKIVKTKLSKDQIFKEESNKYYLEEKFTMPNLKEGCIVEWKYKIISPFKSIDEVQFQYEIPVKKIEVSVETPEYFVYKKRMKGYFSVVPKVEKKQRSITLVSKTRSETASEPTKTVYSQSKVDYFSIFEMYNIENVPALIEESYVSNIENYQAAMEYEYSELHWPNEPIEYYSNTWEDVTKTIYNDSDFSNQIYKSNHFEDDLNAILASVKTDSEKMVATFEFVKHKIKWNNYTGITTFNGTRKAYNEGVGNAADINLNLVSMLNVAGLNANPVIISTRSHGIPLFPTLNGFNFVIAAVELNDEIILLDATDLYSTPNNLPERDLNWQGRLIRKDGSSISVDLTPSQVSETSFSVMITLNEDGETNGLVRKKYTNLSALEYRNSKAKLRDEDIIAKIEGEYSSVEIDEFRINNKENIYKPVVEMYKFNSESLIDVIGNKIYLKPLLFNSATTNPFKLENREYPIDFGTPILENNTIIITIPEGYSVASLPENLVIGLPNNYGVYKFKIDAKGNKINVQAQLQINTAIYPVQSYAEIKEFYSQIVTKNMENIVLEKVAL